ncbi:hypothetical protein [Paenibacillus sedimenti]|uniref:Lipoprotein n=1 Tax=Paenibacillus sedimenti TaxID=2770274 RepID=A0A926KTZ2_9BACL|nr:hypothetical protein [Paenibacillus sedimenti]MBD0382851.1 hypothetical protein [Paenibacillus sedimenti]
MKKACGFVMLFILVSIVLVGCVDEANTSPKNENVQQTEKTQSEQITDTDQKEVVIDGVKEDDAEENAINYTNNEYGFKFSLPASWEGYQIVLEKWEGNSVKHQNQGGVVEKGPMILIRHPEWKFENPRQDIPIMVFTHHQWNSLQQGVFHIGAAPVGPKELDRNHKYVFALPARYNYAFPPGYEEVEKIIGSGALQPIEK